MRRASVTITRLGDAAMAYRRSSRHALSVGTLAAAVGAVFAALPGELTANHIRQNLATFGARLGVGQELLATLLAELLGVLVSVEQDLAEEVEGLFELREVSSELFGVDDAQLL
jgi:hypothetical protein